MRLSPSAHVDTFCRDNLPPAQQWPEFLYLLPELAYRDRLNCAQELLDRTVDALGGDRPCLLTPTESWSYAQLLATANRVAHVLTEDLGVVPGNRVLLRGPNNPWLVACWFGVLKAGGVAVTTVPLLRHGELRQITEMAQAKVGLCDYRYTDDLTAAASGMRIVSYGGQEAAG
ncbi:MAG TPA: 2-aminobenzoate-CoA ligase, partial [Micromonosporaceae bacterium]|nr:2-aminobenzoate-CoA ligase [Micromonosporaceae bacterium]